MAVCRVETWNRPSDHVSLQRPYMFEAGGKFYFWYCIDLAVSEITSPTELDEIINVMKEKGEEVLKTKKILR
jgi:hypothetical protein